MISLVFILGIACCSVLRSTEGVRCWHCENAYSNEDCIDRGRSADCFGEGIGCSSEVRYHAGFVTKIQIRKTCKQTLACGSDKAQNGHGWYPVQCNPKYPDSICRCCCDTDGCNKNLIGCEPPRPDCRKLRVLVGGSISCDNEDHPNAMRTICTFSCDKEYLLKGKEQIQCMLDREGKTYWSDDEPRCIAKRCKPYYKPSKTRKVSCTNKNMAFSVCTFSCVYGYVLRGEEQSTCLQSMNWDYPGPECDKVYCPPPTTAPENSVLACTDGVEVGSVCEYSCLPGFTMVGNSTRECTLRSIPYQITGFGAWSGRMPVCEPIVCKTEQLNPAFGQVECTDKNFLGSSCNFTCNYGYEIRGNSSNVTCIMSENGTMAVWDYESPICYAVKCTELATEEINGQMTCSDSNNIGSVCAFACNEGTFLKSIAKRTRILTQLTLTCLNGGQWSEDVVMCSKIKCYPVFSTMQNGIIECSDNNNYKSHCKFLCDEGYDAIGRTRSMCRRGRTIESPGVWTAPQPRCIRTGCRRQQKTDESVRVTCTDKYKFGSICSFACKRGFYMTSRDKNYIDENEYSIVCIDVTRDWTKPAPSCKPLRCDAAYRTTTNGKVSCTAGNYFKSRCKYTCEVGYGLEGEEAVTCTDEVILRGMGKWTSAKKPKCIRNGCAPRFARPENGRIECTNKNLFFSECSFSCYKGYYMASFENYLIKSGQSVITCSGEGDWSSNGPPSCHPVTCKPLQMNIVYGNVSCSDGANYNSRCDYACHDGYELTTSRSFTKCTDKLSANAYGLWSQEGIKCKRATCRERQRAPNGGKVACSSGHGVGSECIFSCYPGHYMNTTDGIIKKNSLRVKCLREKKWTARAPRCTPVRCPEHRPANSDVVCTKENKYLSKCTVTCLPSYQLKGYNSTSCTGKGDGSNVGKWTRKWPQCNELGCDPKAISSPKNGFTLCSDGAKLRSTCEFTCNISYKRVGVQFSICKRKSATDISWSDPTPECVPIIK